MTSLELFNAERPDASSCKVKDRRTPHRAEPNDDHLVVSRLVHIAVCCTRVELSAHDFVGYSMLKRSIRGSNGS